MTVLNYMINVNFNSSYVGSSLGCFRVTFGSQLLRWA